MDSAKTDVVAGVDEVAVCAVMVVALIDGDEDRVSVVMVVVDMTDECCCEVVTGWRGSVDAVATPPSRFVAELS